MSDARRTILHLVSYPLFSGPLPPTLGLALAQRRLGHTVYLAHDRKRGRIDAFEEAATPRLAGLGFDSPLELTLSTKSSPLELWRDVQCLATLVVRHGVEIVHAHQSHDHTLMALAAARALRVRTVHSNRTLSRRWGQRWLNARADAWIVRHIGAKERLMAQRSCGADRIAVIPGAVDAAAFAPATPGDRQRGRARFGLPPDAVVLGHVALMAGRGQEELVDALSQLGASAPYVLFVGRGEAEASLRARVERAGVGARIRFAGYLRGDELRLAYAAMDAAFVAQPGNDASARAALEAMACGLPVVAVQVDALAELVDASVGFPVATRQATDIASALAQVATDAPGRMRRGHAARELVLRERSYESEARGTLALYESAMLLRA